MHNLSAFIMIRIIVICDKIKNISKNIGTDGTFASVSCHILVEEDFLLRFIK
jgi:hypothetical protein